MSEKNTTHSRLHEITSILMHNELARGITPEKLRKTLEELGPTFVKLGQILSMRADLLPPEYCEQLSLLRTDASTMPYEEVAAIIERSCGSPVEELFESFEQKPLGAASIAQVHRARLAEGGEVVVKVQRDGILDTMREDITLLRKAAKLVKLSGATGDFIDYDMLLDELWNVTLEETDFLHEAENAERFRENCAAQEGVTCPVIYRRCTTRQVLVMEYIDGVTLDSREKLSQMGVDPDSIGRRIAESYIRQVADDGFFHADPHQGNIRVRGSEIVWIDLGMMGRLSARDRGLLAKALTAVARHDVSTVKEVIIALGDCRSRIDHSRLYTDIDDLVSKYSVTDMASMDVTRLVTDVMRVARDHDISIPSGIAILGRGVATLQGLIADLCPEINLVEIASGYAAKRALRSFDWRGELFGSASALVDSGKKSLGIPALVSDILSLSVKGQSRFGIELHSSDRLTQTLQQLVTRISAAVVSAALFVTGGVVCTSSLPAKLCGMPVPAALCFAGGAAAAVWCLWLRKKK